MVHFSNSKEGIHEGRQVRDEAGNVQAFPAWMHSFPPASTFMEISLESFLWSVLNTHFPRARLQTLILEGAGSFRNCQTRTTGSGFCAGEYLILVHITQPLTPFQESLFFVCQAFPHNNRLCQPHPEQAFSGAHYLHESPLNFNVQILFKCRLRWWQTPRWCYAASPHFTLGGLRSPHQMCWLHITVTISRLFNASELCLLTCLWIPRDRVLNAFGNSSHHQRLNIQLVLYKHKLKNSMQNGNKLLDFRLGIKNQCKTLIFILTVTNRHFNKATKNSQKKLSGRPIISACLQFE